MNLLTVTNVTRKEQDGFELKATSLVIPALHKLAIAGETGSGKSTLLKIMAGLVQPDSGKVYLGGERVKGPAEKLIPGHARIAYLSQQYELANFYTVEEVLRYANRLAEKEAAGIYQVCRIDHLLKRRTDRLSGGERQRIAIARLLITSPALLLLDEPFSNTDIIHKNILKAVIHDIGARLGITCVLVSHDSLDMLSWADELIVMKDGEVIQRAHPEQVYRQPLNEYVAGLLGSYNILNLQQASLVPGMQLNRKQPFIRPEQIALVSQGEHVLEGPVQHIIFYGGYYELKVLVAGDMLTVRTATHSLQPGDIAYLSLSASDIWYI